LAGGSGFGLSAADPVVAYLAERGLGFQTGLRPVPLVPTAILFDLSLGRAEAAPTPDLVRTALASAGSGLVPVGSVGAGTGATIGKALGPACSMKGGFGFASLTVESGLQVAAAVAVNAFGDVRALDGSPLAGCRRSPESRELAGAEALLANLPPDAGHPWEGNTTLAVILTNAELTKTAALKVCQMAFGGLYRTLVPALSLFDGDLVALLSVGGQRASINQVGVLAERAVAEAILRGVREADGFGLLPAFGDLGRR
jgi:L-aminopeptidase/D-esterase-like protein